MRFVDTNVLLYAISKEPSEQEKAAIALEILQAEDLCLSVQVLHEFYVQATRRNKKDRINHDQAALLVEAYSRFHVEEMTLSLVRAALAAKERFRISYWDAAIIEAARAASCEVLLTEDLTDEQLYDGVRVVNPFRSK
jgi:predicted nucleic acid-binding protein